MAQWINMEVKLSPESVEFLRGKVASGEYASVSEVLTASIDVLRDEDEERRRFELEEVIPAYDELMANPSAAIPIEQVLALLALRRQRRLVGTSGEQQNQNVT